MSFEDRRRVREAEERRERNDAKFREKQRDVEQRRQHKELLKTMNKQRREPRSGGIFKTLLVGAVIGAGALWIMQNQTGTPSADASPSAGSVEQQEQKPTPIEAEQGGPPEAAVQASPTALEDQAAPPTSEPPNPAYAVPQNDADFIAAKNEALTTGEAKMWRVGGMLGYIVPSETDEGGCRSAFVTFLEDSREAYRSAVATYCMNDQGWQLR